MNPEGLVIWSFPAQLLMSMALGMLWGGLGFFGGIFTLVCGFVGFKCSSPKLFLTYCIALTLLALLFLARTHTHWVHGDLISTGIYLVLGAFEAVLGVGAFLVHFRGTGSKSSTAAASGSSGMLSYVTSMIPFIGSSSQTSSGNSSNGSSGNSGNGSASEGQYSTNARTSRPSDAAGESGLWYSVKRFIFGSVHYPDSDAHGGGVQYTRVSAYSDDENGGSDPVDIEAGGSSDVVFDAPKSVENFHVPVGSLDSLAGNGAATIFEDHNFNPDADEEEPANRKGQQVLGTVDWEQDDGWELTGAKNPLKDAPWQQSAYE